MTAKVTVIIPCFRDMNTVAAAIKSCLDQSVETKVIVVDDASGDETPDIARAASPGNPNLKVLQQARNQGPAAARNRALREVDTEWVALLDADDRMDPERLEHLLAHAKLGNWDFVADDILSVQDWSRLEDARYHWSDRQIGTLQLTLDFFVTQNTIPYVMPGRELGFIKPLMRTEFIERNNLRYNKNMRLAEDYELYSRALLRGARFALVDAEGYYAFNTPGSLSKSHSAEALKHVFLADLAFLEEPDLDPKARRALRRHKQLSYKKWSWVRLIEAVRTNNMAEGARTFVAPPGVIANLVTQLGRHGLRNLPRFGDVTPTATFDGQAGPANRQGQIAE